MKYKDLNFRWWKGTTCDICNTRAQRVAVITKWHVPTFACSPQHARTIEQEEMVKVLDADEMQEGEALKQKIYNLLDLAIAKSIPDETWAEIDFALANALYVAHTTGMYTNASIVKETKAKGGKSVCRKNNPART